MKRVVFIIQLRYTPGNTDYKVSITHYALLQFKYLASEKVSHYLSIIYILTKVVQIKIFEVCNRVAKLLNAALRKCNFRFFYTELSLYTNEFIQTYSQWGKKPKRYT